MPSVRSPPSPHILLSNSLLLEREWRKAWWLRSRVNTERNGGDGLQRDGLDAVGTIDEGLRTAHRLGEWSADKAMLALQLRSRRAEMTVGEGE